VSDPIVSVDDEVHDGHLVRVLTLQRAEQRNPIDKDTARTLRTLLEDADRADEVVGVVITGAGRAFSAGGDLRGYLSLYEDEPSFRSFLDDFAAVNDLLERGGFTSVAMVNGACVAGGLEIALACDLVVAADDAKIGDGHLNFGQLPGAGGSQRLVRAIGYQHAKELLLTGRLLSGAEAAAIGLVHRAVPPGQLREQTFALLAECTRHSPLGVRRMKQLIALSQDTHRAEGLAAELDLVVRYATTSQDATEGLHAFLDRRAPRWSGR
jgi:enoyl-CoA hydratase/carnithine racemase